MDFVFPKEAEEFRQELREFIAQEWRPNLDWRLDSEPLIAYEREYLHKLAKKGWLAIAFPKEYGGAGLPIWQQYVFHEESSYAGAASGNISVGIVGPALLRVGTEDQKKRFIPGIVSGEIEFAIGYTEPSAGSDLASLELRAVEDGDDFVLNGAKIFNTHCHKAEYVWLATRTDTNVPKHKGISVFIVDLKSPGITIKPLWTVGEYRTNAVYYDDVRVPKESLIGEVNRGWYYVAAALDFERLAITPVGGIRRAFDDLVKYVKETKRNGKLLKDDLDVREKIARLSADLEVAQTISWRTAWMVSKGMLPNYEASMLKAFGMELQQRISYLATQIAGPFGTLAAGSKHAPCRGEFERRHRGAILDTISGGSNEIQRNIIATRGLGLPR